jgi:secreted trypsin-like serine protease
MKTELMLDERKAGTCSGDSGGPAYIEKDGQFYLFGITSRGTYFCDDSGVYTNALSYTKWIQDTMGSLK